jgi:acyl-ACP thioesterase
MYQIEKLVSASHVGNDRKLTLSAAVDFMQDCSFFQINAVEKLMDEFAEKNMAMFIISRQLDVIDMPKFNDKLLVRTWVWNLNNIFGSRNTVIYDENLNPKVISYAMGSFVNLSNGHPDAVSDEVVNNVLIEERLEMEYLPRKIRIPDINSEKRQAIPVLKSHIDLYNHVNNAKYIMIATDLLPDDFQTQRMRVEYKIPAKYGDTFYPSIYNMDNEIIVSLNNKEGKAFAIIEFWK